MNCQHTFCLNCIRDWAKKLNKNDVVSCPICNEETKLNGKPIEEVLKPSYVAKAILDQMKIQSQEENVIKCSLCSENVAKFHCPSCIEDLCTDCCNKHENNEITKRHHHTVQPIEERKLEISLKNQNLIDETKKKKDEIFLFY